MSKTNPNTGSDLPPAKKCHREDAFDVTPLHKACESGNPEMVNLLIKNGADVMANATHENYYANSLKNATPLHFAIYFAQ